LTPLDFSSTTSKDETLDVLESPAGVLVIMLQVVDHQQKYYSVCSQSIVFYFHTNDITVYSARVR